MVNTNSLYSVLDIEITLRCNGHCKNCIKLCCTEDRTNLDYSHHDLSLHQIQTVINQIKALGDKHNQIVFNTIFITGGEPLLHPQFREIFDLIKSKLVGDYINHVYINSNGILKYDELKEYIITFSDISQKSEIHNTILVHPDDFDVRPTFLTCNHYRKSVIVLGYHGYNLCCAADGYMRLFGKDNLFVKYLPEKYEFFPLEQMDEICQHCPFGSEKIPLEINLGSPISKIYLEQIDLKNKITKVFGE
jgi:hypothetical protein